MIKMMFLIILCLVLKICLSNINCKNKSPLGATFYKVISKGDFYNILIYDKHEKIKDYAILL